MEKGLVWQVKLFVVGIIIILAFIANTILIPVPLQIEDYAFIQAVGIDKGIENPKNVKLTIISENFATDSSNGNKPTEKTPDIFTAEGRTIFEAERKIRASYQKSAAWGHIKYILIGEELAKENILDFLDAFIRHWQTRLNVNVLIVKNVSAENLINMSKETRQFIPDTLKGLLANSSRLSLSREVELSEAISVFEDHSADFYFPSISMKESHAGENVKKEIELNGFGVFKGTQLIDFITSKQARGLNWITRNIKTPDITDIIVQDSSGNDVSLGIIDTSSKIETRFNSLPEITIRIRLSALIGEQQSQVNIYTEDTIMELQKQLKNSIEKDVKAVLSFAQKNRVDIFGIGDVIYHRYPSKWKKIKSQWKPLFSRLPIKIRIEARILRSQLMNKPIRSGKGD